MAETIGSLADKISIIHLKIYHMREQLARPDVDDSHRESSRDKLAVMRVQLADLEDELTALVADVGAGRARLKIYRQFKMYNDPRYRAAKGVK